MRTKGFLKSEKSEDKMELEFDLPIPAVFTIAEPWILYRGRLYQPAKSIDQVIENFMDFGIRFPLEEIESPKGLEDLYFLKHAQTIEQSQQEYMQRAVNTEYRSRSAIEQELGRNQVMTLLVTKVLPVITNFSADDQIARLIEEEQGISHQDNFIDVMASGTRMRRSSHEDEDSAETRREIRRQKQRLIQTISDQYRQFEVQTPVAQQDSVFDQLSRAIERRRASPDLVDNSILTSQIFPQRNIMCHNGVHELVTSAQWISYFRQYIDPRFYRRLQAIPSTTNPDEIYNLIKENLQLVEKRYLSRLVNKLKSGMICLDGNYLFPIKMDDDNPQEIQLLYKKLIEKQVKLGAIEHNEFQAVQMMEISRQRDQLARIANLNRFELNGAGYERHGDTYYVYVSTGEYALFSPHISDSRRYLAMRNAKVGVTVSYDGGRFVIGNPVVMNDYRHPFLPSSSGAMKNLCMGQYNPSSAKRLPPEEAISTLLSKAKEILLMGYRRGSNPYPENSLTRDRWRGWITKREVERKHLPCLNEFER